MERLNICGLLFDNMNIDEAIVHLERQILNSNSKPEFVLIANQDIINKKSDGSILNDSNLNKSYLTVPDGFSIIYAAKILGSKLKERIPGPDLMERMISISDKKGYSHFFLGAQEGIAQKMADKFREKYKNLKISGIYSPPFCKEFSENENNKIISMINNSKCDILWVSFGCPKQESWIIKNIEKLNVKLAIGVGAAFDFHSGNIVRAPEILQKMRLEWFHRFLQEPKRLFSRYFIGGFQFLKLIIKHKKILKRGE